MCLMEVFIITRFIKWGGVLLSLYHIVNPQPYEPLFNKQLHMT